MDEFFEMFTMTQLGYQNKPCAILNSSLYYEHLIRFLDHSVKEGFLTQSSRELIITAESSDNMLDKLGIV